MSDTMFWALSGLVLLVGLGLVARVIWLNYREWGLFADLIAGFGKKD